MKRFRSAFSIIAILCGCIWVIFLTTRQPLPNPSDPLHIYSNHVSDDLQKMFAAAIQEAKHSLHLTMYGLTDPYLLGLLSQKIAGGVTTTIFYDPSGTPEPPPGHAFPINLSGALMHRKILLVDHEKVFVGTANFTPSSLKAHDNLVVGMYEPALADFLTRCESESCAFKVGQTSGELWLLPSQAGLKRILDLLANAKKEIRLAMFTLTHPLLTDALIAANARGVDVRIALDHYTAEGASAKTVKKLRDGGVPVHLSQGQQLFHHKWALIDRKTLVIGSANWTGAAFTNNQDCFIIFHNLEEKTKKKIKKIWKIIELESIQS